MKQVKTCDFCNKVRKSFSCLNGGEESFMVCFICIKEMSKHKVYSTKLGKYVCAG